jgi:crossover junction endodeoxyribonuclease RusA
MPQFSVTCYLKPQPQGSSRAFVRNGKAAVTSTNKKLKPYRQDVTQICMEEISRSGFEMIGKHIPVGAILDFRFRKPPSVPKKRKHMVVKPDIDKLVRATFDALSGVVYHDDATVVDVHATKEYTDGPEFVKIDIFTI